MCFGETVVTSTERLVESNGVQLRVVEAGEQGNPTVLLVHGFPELAFSWRHQIPALADAGYRVLAPDMRGYGRSSRPDSVTDYTVAALAGDLLAVLDDADVDRAVFVGHDWGAAVVWNAAQLHPERVAAVVGMSVPPLPRGSVPPTESFGHLFGDNFFYMLYIQQPGVADAELGKDPATTMSRLFGGPIAAADRAGARERMFAPGPQGWIERLPQPVALPDWITQKEFDHYVAEFTRTGFTGGLNWYRNLDRNWELTASVTTKIDAPAMFLTGAADPVSAFMPADRAAEVVNGPLHTVSVAGAGHWVQQEKPDEVNAALLEFLKGLS